MVVGKPAGKVVTVVVAVRVVTVIVVTVAVVWVVTSEKTKCIRIKIVQSHNLFIPCFLHLIAPHQCTVHRLNTSIG